MRLGIKMLNNSSSVNTLMYMNQVQINPNDTATVLFQIVDSDLAGQRYIPASGAALTINLVSVDKSKNIMKIPINPYVDDKSIWSFNLSASETAVAAGVNMKVTLTQGADVKSVTAEAVIVFGSQSKYSC